MRAYSNMPQAEFLQQLRDVLIQVNAAPLVIDQVDKLAELQGVEAELEQLREALSKMEEQRDHYRAALQDLLTDMGDCPAALRSAQIALDEKF